MKKGNFIRFGQLFCLIMVITSLASCSERVENIADSDLNSKNSVDEVVNLYNAIMSSSTGCDEIHTRAENEGKSYFSRDDLNYLSSLTEKEFKELHSSIVEACGGSESIETIQTHNYMVLYDEITDNGTAPERMTRLKSFCEDYLTKKNGKSSLESLLPNGLTDLEVKIYASQAVFIDMVTRPVYDHIEEMELMKAYENDFPWCKTELGIRIALLGLKIGVEAFLDAMSEGIGTLELILEITDAGADVMDMWLQYEVCNERWH